jgi:membrane protein insertase Oxa1/YidC/SpoIIIJ
MSIMMLLFFYKIPAGLNLYIMFSSLFGAIEQHRIRKHIKEHEEAGTLLKPAKTSADRLSKRERTGKMSFVEKLQKMAEEAQKAQPPHPGKGKKKT